jgi:hypothetical protein
MPPTYLPRTISRPTISDVRFGHPPADGTHSIGGRAPASPSERHGTDRCESQQGDEQSVRGSRRHRLHGWRGSRSRGRGDRRCRGRQRHADARCRTDVGTHKASRAIRRIAGWEISAILEATAGVSLQPAEGSERTKPRPASRDRCRSAQDSGLHRLRAEKQSERDQGQSDRQPDISQGLHAAAPR